MNLFHPGEAGARPAPRSHEGAGRIELDDMWSRCAAGFLDRVGLRPLNDHDVIAGIDADAAYRTDNPVVGQRFRPRGVDFKRRNRGLGGADWAAGTVRAPAQAHTSRTPKPTSFGDECPSR